MLQGVHLHEQPGGGTNRTQEEGKEGGTTGEEQVKKDVKRKVNT